MRTLLFFAFLFLAATTIAQTPDNTIKPIFSGNANILAMAKQSDGKLIVAGDFLGMGSTLSAKGLLRLNTDGSVDHTFNSAGSGVFGQIYRIMMYGDDKMIIAGNFSAYNGTSVAKIARLNADGTLDNTFNPGTGPAPVSGSIIYNVVRQSTGKLIVLGGFNAFNGTTRTNIVRLEPNGTIDVTFTASYEFGGANRYNLVVQPDDKVLIANVSNLNGIAVNKIGRLNADGTLDTNFATALGTGPNSDVYALGLQSDNKIIISGFFSSVNGTAAQNIARLNTTGAVDNTFAASFSFNASPVNAIKVLSNNKFLSVGGRSAQWILLHNADGTVDNTFNTSGAGPNQQRAYLIETQNSEADFVFAGDFLTWNGALCFSLVRTSSTGVLDNTFLPKPIGPSRITKIKESGGSIFVSGTFSSVNGIDRRGLVKLSSTGVVDNTFNIGTGFNQPVNAFEIDGTSVVVGGEFNQYNGNARQGIVKLTSTGAIDPGFTCALGISFGGDGIRDMHRQSDGKIIIGGAFISVNGTNKRHLARINANGSLDATFNATDSYTANNESVRNFDVRSSDGKIVMTQFPYGSGSIDPRVVLASATGTKETDFSAKIPTNQSSSANTAMFLPDGRILIGGYIQNYDGTSVSRQFVVVNDAGTRDPSFAYSVNDNRFAATSAAIFNGRILFGLDTRFSLPSVTSGSFLGVADLTGRVMPLQNSLEVREAVNTLSTEPANTTSFLVGGVRTVNGSAYPGFAKLQFTTSIASETAPTGLQLTNVTPSGMRLTWTETVNNETAFEVQRSKTNTANFATVAYVPVGVNQLDDTGLDPASVYFYRVRAVTASSATAFSSNASATTLPAIPANPSFLTTTASTVNSITLQWNDNSTNETGFEIHRATVSGGTFTLVTTVPSNSTATATYTDGSLTPNTSYFYKVRAVNGVSLSAFTSEVSRATLADIPAAPSNISFTPLSFNKVRVRWTDNSNNETGFRVFYAGVLVFSTAANVETYVLENLTSSAIVQITSFNNNGESLSSASIFVGLSTVSGGAWEELGNTPMSGRSGAVGFSINGKGYVALGRNNSGALNDLWEYDPATNLWIQRADFPGTARIGAFAFVIDGRAYVGTGNDFSGTGFKRDVYEYNPANNTWTAKADFPEDFNAGAGITSGVSFVVNNLGYVGLGNTGLNNTKAFYRYTPTTNTWTPIAEFAGAGRIGAVAFVRDNRGHVALGYGGLSDNLKDIWSYNPTTNTWTAGSDLPGSGRGGATAMSIQGNGVICAGEEGSFSSQTRTKKTNYFQGLWVTALDLPAQARTSAASFVIGDKGYVFGGVDGTTYFNDLHSFVPGYALIPQTPANVLVSYDSPTSLKITWEDKSNNETNFVLEVSVNAGASVPVVTLPANTTTYIHTGLSNGSNYQYQLRATNTLGASNTTFSSVFRLIPPPAAPTNLTITAAVSTTTLSWIDNANNEVGFDIYRSVGNNSNFVKIQTLAANATSFTNTLLNSDTEYFYRVEAVNASGAAASNVVSIRTPGVPPSNFTSFTASSNAQNRITLTWSDTNTETSYELSRATGVTSTLLATLLADTVTYTDETVIPGVSYTYRIKAINAFGSNLTSQLVFSATLLAPEAPTNLQVALVNNEVALTWVDNSPYESAFTVFRTVGSGTEQQYQNVAKDAVAFTDKTFVSGQTNYTYRLRAINAAGSSTFSNEVSIQLPIQLVTGLEEASSLLLLYPVPAHNQLVIKNQSDVELKIKIMDVWGKEAYHTTLSGKSQVEVSVEQWVKGVYIVETNTNNAAARTKLVID